MTRHLQTGALAAGLVAALASVGWVAGRVAPGAFVDAEPAFEQLDFGEIKRTTQRRRLKVPADYGDLVAVTAKQDGTSELWFSDGTLIRNVTLESGAVLVERGGRIVK